jgi:hypothetical protein
MLYSHTGKSRLGGFPCRMISSPIRNLLLDYVLNKKWSMSDVSRLDKDDQKALTDILELVGLQWELGLDGMDDVSKDMKRFEILKGELAAGNDNKEIIREMQLIVLRLKANRHISKQRANEVMYDLVCLL